MPRLKIRDFLKSIQTDGSSIGLTIPGLVPDIAAFSFGIWVNIEDFTNNLRIVDWSDAGPEDGFSLLTRADSTVRVDAYAAASADAAVASSVLKKGRWHFIVVTFEQNSLKVYTDSVLSNTDTSIAMTAAAATMTLFRRTTGATNFAKGRFDDFMFFNHKVLTQAEIDALYFDYKIPSGISCHLKFDDDLTDASHNGLNGSAIGTPAYTTNVRFTNRTRI